MNFRVDCRVTVVGAVLRMWDADEPSDPEDDGTLMVSRCPLTCALVRLICVLARRLRELLVHSGRSDFAYAVEQGSAT